MYWSRELANFTIPFFFHLLLKFIWEYYTTRWFFNNALLKSRNMIYTNTAQTKYWFWALYLLEQYFKLAFEPSFIAWQKKALPCQILTEPIDLMGTIINDSALIQWLTGIVRLTAIWSNDVGGSSGAAVIFQGDRVTLYHNPATI